MKVNKSIQKIIDERMKNPQYKGWFEKQQREKKEKEGLAAKVQDIQSKEEPPINEIIITETLDKAENTKEERELAHQEENRGMLGQAASGVLLKESFGYANVNISPRQFLNIYEIYGNSLVGLSRLAKENKTNLKTILELNLRFTECAQIARLAEISRSKLLQEESLECFSKSYEETAVGIDKQGNTALIPSFVNYNTKRSEIMLKHAQIAERGTTLDDNSQVNIAVNQVNQQKNSVNVQDLLSKPIDEFEL